MDNMTLDDIGYFADFLASEERSINTIEKYSRDIRRFCMYLNGDFGITKEKIIGYKAFLATNYKVSSANSMLAAVNKYLEWKGLHEYRVKSLKVQKQIFRDKGRELSRKEYECLIRTARKQKKFRLEMIMQTICGTGIRIGELPFITVEAVKLGEAMVLGKGKRRVIFITAQLRKYLLEYCRSNDISTGSVFITKNGQPLNRSNIWTEMKRLCKTAGVDRFKVFPHNLRHLFARICYQKKKNIAYLADILGHSSIETTRIYTITSGGEHKKMLASLGLVI